MVSAQGVIREGVMCGVGATSALAPQRAVSCRAAQVLIPGLWVGSWTGEKASKKKKVKKSRKKETKEKKKSPTKIGH